MSRVALAIVFLVTLLPALVFSQTEAKRSLSYFAKILDLIVETSVYPSELESENAPIWNKSLNSLGIHPKISVDRKAYLAILANEVEKHSSQSHLFIMDVLKSLVRELPDPYAALLSPEQIMAEKLENAGGNFNGFGLEFGQAQDGVRLVRVIPGSPAAKAGLQVGEKLLTINQIPVNNVHQVYEQIDDAENDKLQLQVEKNRERIVVTLEKGKIHLVPFNAKIIGNVGYVQMEVIVPENESRFLSALHHFSEDHADSMILDLRNCIGGDLQVASHIVGNFLQPGDVVYIKQTKENKTPYYSFASNRTKVQLVVLIGPATASAGELIAGALKDHQRAVLYGSHTLGKGSIQTTWMLEGGWELRLTTAHYLTPSGAKVDGVGIEPNGICRFKGKTLNEQLRPILKRFWQRKAAQ